MRGDYLPGILAGALVVVGALGSLWAGFSYPVAIVPAMFLPAFMVALGVTYGLNHPSEVRFFELPYFMGWWIIFPVFGTEVTYLGLKAGFAFQDGFYSHADAALGFDWPGWWRYLQAHPGLNGALRHVYNSSYWQPFITVLAIVYWKPGGRNAEFLLAILLALYVTILGAMLWPAIGPIAYYGVDPHLANFIANIRSADPKPSFFAGIIVFPSFHTIMAILFVWANRGMPTFWPFVVLNSLMLAAIPTVGDHYMVDLVAGAAVASVAIWMAPKLLARFR